jgi:hypothetical protein
MTGYTVSLAAALFALAARGFPLTAGIIALSVSVTGAALDLVYIRRRVRPRLAPWRTTLDKIVRRQLLAIGALGLAIILVGETTGYHPFGDASVSVKAIIVGAVIGVGTVYVSSLIDWYWILPRISGTTGPAPCEHAGSERWAGLTNVWFFHRAVATSVVIGILAGVPAYIAGNSGSNGTAWALLGAALAVGYSSVNTGVRAALEFAFNAPLHVGDTIRVRANPEDGFLSDAYVVDVSIQGLKYKLLDGPDGRPRFVNKGEPLTMQELTKTRRSQTPRSPCPGPAQCKAINWYCHRNPRANTSVAADEKGEEPATFPEAVPAATTRWASPRKSSARAR